MRDRATLAELAALEGANARHLAHGIGAAVGHFTGPGDTWAASAAAKRLPGMPDERLVREIISLGYPAEHLQPTPSPPGRKPLTQLVRW